jgi:hypothetical protein
VINRDETLAWDCDPFFIPDEEPYDLDLDDEDAFSDWQVLVLDRFGDRMVTE